MNWDTVEAEWKQLKGQVRAKWAKLTDEDLSALSAKKTALISKIQERYGVLKDEAEKQVDEWMSKLGHMHERKAGDPAERKEGGSGGPRSPQ